MLSINDPQEDNPNDGLILIKDAEWGEHLANFDADHFELIGMRQKYDATDLFDFYANTIKCNDEDFNKYSVKYKV